jgi:hypothetical protein
VAKEAVGSKKGKGKSDRERWKWGEESLGEE